MQKHFPNWLLSLSVIALLYGVLEFFALWIFFYFLPPAGYPLLDDGIRVLLQSSKQSLVPKNYIGIAGDSYAMGLGDQYYQNAGQMNARYGSAYYLQSLTGKDILSFGSAGDGSIASMVTEPFTLLSFFNADSRLSIAPPSQLLVFFYEGNDLNDNVEYLQRASKKRKPFDYAQLENSLYFQAYMEEVAIQQDGLYQHTQHLRCYQQLYLAKFIGRSLVALTRQLFSQAAPETKVSANKRSPLNPPGRFEWQQPGIINQALINNETVQLPDKLQGPSMDLSAEEKHLALVSFREALRFLKHGFSKTPITVVYIPSVITTYAITSTQISVQSHARRKQFIFPASTVIQQSNWIAEQIQQLSEAEHVSFIDARTMLREAAHHQLLHGPLDWNHFNGEGYQVLAQQIAAKLSY